MNDISYFFYRLLKNWLARLVGNEGPSTYTGWYIGDETSLIPYESPAYSGPNPAVSVNLDVPCQTDWT